MMMDKDMKWNGMSRDVGVGHCEFVSIARTGLSAARDDSDVFRYKMVGLHIEFLSRTRYRDYD